mmetsp:Transcript_15051/g.39974  ORF Transcript_15051/g.39974 Transcript_15051/m.39974 type:complete len:137 (-) Transcript_15051:131-541(-)
MSSARSTPLLAAAAAATLVGAKCPPVADVARPRAGMAGGPTAPRKPDDAVAEIVAKAGAGAALLSYRQKEGENLSGRELPLRICHYTTQVVAGINYTVAVSTSDTVDEWFEITIYKPLPFMNKPPRVSQIVRKSSA